MIGIGAGSRYRMLSSDARKSGPLATITKEYWDRKPQLQSCVSPLSNIHSNGEEESTYRPLLLLTFFPTTRVRAEAVHSVTRLQENGYYLNRSAEWRTAVEFAWEPSANESLRTSDLQAKSRPGHDPHCDTRTRPTEHVKGRAGFGEI